MKKKKSTLLCVLLSLMMFVMAIPEFTVSVSAASLTKKSGEVINSGGRDQIKGTEDGYSYELWNQNDQGSAKMVLGSGGAFSCEWSSIQNVLFRRGVDFDCTKTYKEIGAITVEYEADYNIPNTENSYLCVYGWTKSPLIEYYIVDSWGSWRPPGGQGHKGVITVDGGEYDVYMVEHDGPSIEQGVNHFTQCWSVRKQKRSSGTISVSQHFAEWEKLGMQTGKLYEAALNVEGYMSNGKANVKKNVVTVGGEIKDPEPVKPVEPDANGYYFHSTFESGTDNWEGRGSASVATAGSAYKGSKCLSVTGRTDNWNGASIPLSTTTFVPGNSYSFSVMAMQNTVASDDFKLTLQYSSGGEDHYDEVATAKGSKGEWVQLANSSFTIPTGASNLLLYVEMPESKDNSFFIDEAIGAKGGTIIKEEGSQPSYPAGSSKGDLNGDGKVDVNDVKALQSFLAKKSSTIKDGKLADVNGDGKVNAFDLVALKRLVKNPQPATTTAPSNPGNTTTTTTTTKQQQQNPSNPSMSPSQYMEKVKGTITANVPGSATANANCNIKSIQYQSSVAGKMKTANVLLPEGYSENEKYPVMYCNHGIFGDENSMIGMGVANMATNLMKSGEAEKMIVVFPQMYSGPDNPQGITPEVEANYDKFLEDLTQCLMPYIEQHFSVKTGRENTAISGFSMGGRETLYIGVSRPDVFGFIGAACPAPGVTPGDDFAGHHAGCMSESEFKITDANNQPYILMITGGTNDGVVGTFPQSYHNILTKNGQDHIWQEIPGGGHDNSCVNPLMYNFIRNIFKTGASSNGSSNNNNNNQTNPTNPTPSTGSYAVDPSKPMVAISFDDGAVGTASNSTSMRILNALNKENFRATFFYVGNWTNNADKEAEVKKAYDMGMEVANHTMSHPNLTEKSPNEIRSEYDGCAQKLKGIIGAEPSKLMRLPYLASNNTVQSTLNDVPLISCGMDTQDWNNASKDQIVAKIKQAAQDGSLNGQIVLCHETYETTAAAMEELCPYLKSMGWQIVTISDMYKAKGKNLAGGQVHTKC